MASIVVTCDCPMLSIVVMQERVGAPSTCTVQAPHSAIPQPNFVPVKPSTSRSTHNSGVSPSTSTLWMVPLTLIENAMTPLSEQIDGNVDVAVRCFRVRTELVCFLRCEVSHLTQRAAYRFWYGWKM